MSRLTELLAQVKNKDSQLGKDLEREFKVLASRRSFGLNFERHRPEAVELPQRPIRTGDKVRILPERGSTKKGDQRLWVVKSLKQNKKGALATVSLLIADEENTEVVPVDDLVVVAEFQDYIYPGLVSTGKAERGGEKPFHTVINGENYHALKALSYTHRGKIDAIYIDPPYNTRDKDWKYNNDYVDSDDIYKHSKWLAMMERRLKLARTLLNPSSSVLLVSIDEKEVHRLGLLLEQLFPDSTAQMVTSVISAKGAIRVGKFSRVEEHIFVIPVGEQVITRWTRNMLDPLKDDGVDSAKLEWLGLRRREPTSARGARPNQFYPIFVHKESGQIHSIGDAVDDEVDRNSVSPPSGTVALWPLKPDGKEMLWGLTPQALRKNLKRGFVRVNSWSKEKETGTVQYLPSGTIKLIKEGLITITGKAKDGSVEGSIAADDQAAPPPKRVWNLPSHNAETGGTNILSSLVPNRRFPYPKSLFAVEDTLRFFIQEKPNAIVLDFFAGSGTTAHAVMRLNRQDGGQRQCILVTNNEIGADEEKALRKSGYRAGDNEWEQLGICDFITKPRLQAAITGRTHEGKKAKGNYNFTDEFPISDGLEENAEFFRMTYESPIAISHNLAFQKIAPLLWLRAGSQGKRIDKLPTKGWGVVETYGLLTDLDSSSAFCEAVNQSSSVRVAYIVTNDDKRFQAVSRRLPSQVEAVRLYESYLTNFKFTSGD